MAEITIVFFEKRDAVRLGMPDKHWITVDATVSVEDRATLADAIGSDRIEIHSSVAEHLVGDLTAASLAHAIRARAAAEASDRQQQIDAAVAKAASMIRSREPVSQTRKIYVSGDVVTWTELTRPYISEWTLGHLSYNSQMEYAAWADEIDQANGKAKAEAAAQANVLREEQQQRRQVAAEEIATWIEAHGSDRLRRLSKEGIEHDAVYRDERLAIDRPGWMFSDRHTDEPRNAPAEALNMLDQARESVPDAVLQWSYRYRAATDDDDPDCVDSDNEVRVEEYVATATYLERQIVFLLA